MRDENRLKERFTLSLDGRQVASIAVGSLVILAAVFVLGFSVGRQLGPRPERPAGPVDPLAALDAPAPRPDAGEAPPRLSYHETLTRERPGGLEPVRPAPAVPSTSVPASAAAPAARTAGAAPEASGGPGDRPVRPGVATAASRDLPGEAASVAPAPGQGATPAPLARAPAAGFAIQVGAAQDRVEAERLAERFRAHRPRVVEAIVPGKGRWYRVKLGAFDSRADAERYLADLSRETGARGFVTSWN